MIKCFRCWDSEPALLPSLTNFVSRVSTRFYKRTERVLKRFSWGSQQGLLQLQLSTSCALPKLKSKQAITTSSYWYWRMETWRMWSSLPRFCKSSFFLFFNGREIDKKFCPFSIRWLLMLRSCQSRFSLLASAIMEWITLTTVSPI